MMTISDWNPNSKILMATDHGGIELKNSISAALRKRGVEVEDMGPHCLDADDDYPDYAAKLASAISRGEAERGILVCRSGIGMAINANRFHGVRSALVSTVEMARKSREHNCSNVLVLGGDCLSLPAAMAIVDAWLSTPFSGENRHSRRIEKIEWNSWDEIAPVRSVDPEIASMLDAEAVRQADGIELIASENFASAAVRAAQGSVLTNKYAEGYPGKRYYGGCEKVDEVESLAIERAKRLFGADAANVQPHSGSQANMAVYFALIKPGDTVLAMDLAHGGHLTHGHPMNFSGSMYKIVSYGVSRETETIDYSDVARLAAEHKPKMIVAGASAYPRVLDFPRLREIADAVGAFLFVDMAHIAGLVAAGIHPSPIPFADVVTTTTHKTLRGPRGGLILMKERFAKEINSKIFPGIQGGPLMHVIAAKAVCFHEAAAPAFSVYQRQVVANAAKLAAELAAKGFRIVSGGTDNHLMLVDLRPKGATGRAVQDALDKARITVNKNMIPFDTEKPMVTSGIRVGTPAVTTRGMPPAVMERIADWIDRGVSSLDSPAKLAEIGAEVEKFMRGYPMPRF